MTKAKIKQPNPHATETKAALLCLLAKHDVYCNRAIPVRDGFLTILSEANDTDNLFKQATIKDLADEQFIPILPPEIKVRRTVHLFGVDSHLLQHSSAEIQEEIERLNEYTEKNIDSIFKFPNNAPIIKITFLETLTAQKCLETGLKMYNLRIPSHSIKQEEYIPIQTCMRCYKVEEHNTTDCPKDANYKAYSECGTEGHVWQIYHSYTIKCLN